METEEKPKTQFVIVKGLVINSEGKILMVQRKKEWHKEAHAKWEFPGGKVDFGETPAEACIREVREESGFNVKIRRLLPEILSSRWEYPNRHSQQILICYLCDLIDGKISLEDHGVMDVKWYPPEEILKLDVLPGTHEFLKEYLKQLVG